MMSAWLCNRSQFNRKIFSKQILTMRRSDLWLERRNRQMPGMWKEGEPWYDLILIELNMECCTRGPRLKCWWGIRHPNSIARIMSYLSFLLHRKAGVTLDTDRTSLWNYLTSFIVSLFNSKWLFYKDFIVFNFILCRLLLRNRQYL